VLTCPLGWVTAPLRRRWFGPGAVAPPRTRLPSVIMPAEVEPDETDEPDVDPDLDLDPAVEGDDDADAVHACHEVDVTDDEDRGGAASRRAVR
jgi:CDP-diacylglycerol--serine O-phosphatidyltransferase